MTNTDQAGGNPAAKAAAAPAGPLKPSQALAERLLAARNTLAKATDQLEDVLASVHGRPRPQPDRPPVSPVTPDHRRFFPAADRLIGEIEAEASRIAVLAEGFDNSF